MNINAGFLFLRQTNAMKTKNYWWSSKHQNLQTGPINANIIFSKYPEINYLVKDTVLNKEEIIYNSELEKQK